jgi:uncharacterized protein (DUF952 family)
MRSKLVYKICSEEAWTSEEIRRGSGDDRRDGFIHFSTAAQVPGTLTRHFADKRRLVLLSFEAAAFGDRLRWEPSRGGALFPHLYGSIEPSIPLRCVGRFPEGPDGSPILPDSWLLDDGEIHSPADTPVV